MSGTTTATPAYDFDADTQAEIVALIMLDADFLRRSDGLIKAAYFADEVDQGFVSLALEHWSKYSDAPTIAAWKELVKNGFSRKPGVWRDALKADVVARLGVVSRAPVVRGKAFLLDKIEEFAQHQAIINGLLSSVQALGKVGDPTRFDKVRQLMDGALRVAVATDDAEYDYFERIDHRTAERLAVAGGSAPKTGITTGIKELDELLYNHGGWGRGELSLFMGPLKGGKSFFLTFCAASAMLAGYNILFISCENSLEIAVDRMDAAISDVAMRDFTSSPHGVAATLKAKVAASGGSMKVHFYPNGTFRPRDLRRLLEDYQARGIEFDLVVIDYLDEMAADEKHEVVRENTTSIYRTVRGIAGAYRGRRGKLGVLSATQTNREGVNAAVAGKTHIAEDINKGRLCDILLSINRTEEEKAAGKARLNITAARNVEDGITLFIKQDLGKGKAVSEVESVE